MGLLSRHIDRLLPDFSAGDLPPRRTRRMVEHAKGCERCRARLNQVLAAQRVLQGSLFRPADQEQAAWAAGAAAVVAASAARPARSDHRALLLAFAGVAAACLALFVLWPRPGVMGPEFGVRGDGKGAQASLRVYCAAPDGELVELGEGKACRTGSALGFAAGAAEPFRHLRLKVVQDGKALAGADFAVAGKPGAEEALELSVALERPGKAHVEAAFAEKQDGLETSKLRLTRDVAVEAR